MKLISYIFTHKTLPLRRRGWRAWDVTYHQLQSLQTWAWQQVRHCRGGCTRMAGMAAVAWVCSEVVLHGRQVSLRKSQRRACRAQRSDGTGSRSLLVLRSSTSSAEQPAFRGRTWQTGHRSIFCRLMLAADASMKMASTERWRWSCG